MVYGVTDITVPLGSQLALLSLFRDRVSAWGSVSYGLTAMKLDNGAAGGVLSGVVSFCMAKSKDGGESGESGHRRVEKPFRPYKVGAPTLYEDSFPERAIEMGMKGYSFVLIARDLGVVRQTLYDWARRHPEFADALMHAREYSLGFYEQLGLSGITAGREFNDRQFLVMAGNLHPREYRNRVEHTGAVAALDFSRMTDEQLTRIKAGENPYVVLAATRALTPGSAPPENPNELQPKAAPADEGTGAAGDGSD